MGLAKRMKNILLFIGIAVFLLFFGKMLLRFVLVLTLNWLGQGGITITPKMFSRSEHQAIARLVAEGEVEKAIEEAKKIEQGLDFIGPEGDTLLKLAARANDAKLVEKLLAAGASPNVPKEGTPLALVAEMSGEKIFNLLLNSGADPDGMANREPALSWPVRSPEKLSFSPLGQTI
jgi:hypothetical protein